MSAFSEEQCCLQNLFTAATAFDAEFCDAAVNLCNCCRSASVMPGGPFWAGLKCEPVLLVRSSVLPWIAQFAIKAHASEGPGSMFGLCSREHDPTVQRAFTKSQAWMFCSRTGTRWHGGKAAPFVLWTPKAGDVMVSTLLVCLNRN